ncbi:hypothetical protein [Bianquea renquensis]|uniref:Uncharacterized protein n=1 Tax=Bianquea renquensis TaxID=2763661 RepID=A0A926DRM9_9FIRM|nr:hypothetical protein [Bianquea renquensis]MBC8543968.1 hypothetical protein [Bianquea renquensis]
MAAHERKKEEKSRTKWLLLFLLLLLLIASISITIWALFFRRVPTLAPDYAPRQEEPYAEDMGDDSDEKLTQVEGGGAVSLTYTTEVHIVLSEERATLYFANPSKSNQDMVLQILVQDVVIAQSGTILPGKQIEKLDLLEDAAAKLQPGGYNGEFVVLYYQPDTHEKTIVNTEIPVNITVES